MGRPRRVVLEDLAELRWAMEPAAHPAEGPIAFVVSGPDSAIDRLSYDLFVSDAAEEGRLFEKGARAPRWSPDGEQIAFARRDGDRWVPGCRSLSDDEWVIPTPPGDLVDLRWAPDGHRLLITTVEWLSSSAHVLPYPVSSAGDWGPTERRRAWIVESGEEPIAVAEGLGNVSVAEWSPDGKQIALVSDHGVDRDTSLAAGLWTWRPNNGHSTCVVDPAVPIHALAWSPDGAAIAFLKSSRNNSYAALNELWVVESDSSPRQLGAEIDRSIGKAVRGDDERAVGAPILNWSASSEAVLAIYADGGRSRLARFELEGGHEDLIATDQCVLEFSVGGGGIAFSWSDPATPGEISWLDAGSGDIRQVTNVGGKFLTEVEMAPTTRISSTASDGVDVEGWLTLPAEETGAPLVLQVHGGPHYPIGERFSFDSQRLAARGIAVLRANPRGSQGYGQAFADGNLGDWGGRDLDDLLELVGSAVETAGLDPRRVAVIGESYGGYMAAWAVAMSDRFAAAVVENGISDFLSSAGGPIGPTFWHDEMGAPPWENPSIYMERSVITKLHHIDVPVLVIHCEADQTCNIAQGEAIHSGLAELGREVEFVRVPEEGHFFNVFGALSRRLARTAALDDFLARKLGPAEKAETNTEEFSK